MTPFAMVIVPVIALVAAISVLFETVAFLRGGLGNVVYFFAWIFGLSSGTQASKTLSTPWTDPLGIFMVGNQVHASVVKIAPHAAKGFDLVIGSDRAGAHERLFVWHGFVVTSAGMAGRLTWCAVAFAIVCLAALLFDRFANSVSPARERAPKAWRVDAANAFARAFAPLLDVIFTGDFGALVLAELRLMLKGSSVWWYVVAAGLWIATLAAPASQRSIVLGLAWLWPILTWSQMGTRESLNDTEGFVFPSLHPLSRQFAALWIAGIALALLTGSGALLHCAVAGNWPAAAAIVTGAIFIPTLALACGAASGTSRLFEIVYLLLWYVGPMNATKGIDFTSVSAMGFAAIASVALAFVAFAARRARLQQA